MMGKQLPHMCTGLNMLVKQDFRVGSVYFYVCVGSVCVCLFSELFEKDMTNFLSQNLQSLTMYLRFLNFHLKH